MKPRTLFLLSLLVILALNFVDVLFFGIYRESVLSQPQKQAVHMTVMSIVAIIGYYNWKQQGERWLRQLWIAAYALAFLIMVPLFISYISYGNLASHKWQRALLNIRNLFSGPLPFLVFYLLMRLTRANRQDQQ